VRATTSTRLFTAVTHFDLHWRQRRRVLFSYWKQETFSGLIARWSVCRCHTSY